MSRPEKQPGPPSFAGAVLTGGRSSRMGRDKALLPVGGRPLVLRPVDALRAAGAAPVFTVGGDLAALGATGVEAIADPGPQDGPLRGIAGALGHVTGDTVVMVLACDLPNASALAVTAVVRALLAAPHADVAVPVVDDRWQPLHAAWRRAALPAVERALAEERRAVHAALDDLATVTVTGLDPAWFVNANAPRDLRSVPVGQTGAMTDAAVPEIDVAELARRQSDGAFVLDVRNPAEYEAGHVPGAVLLPLGELGARFAEVPGDRPLLVICRSGARSAAAVEALAAAGYDATNVAGGTLAWIEAGYAVAEGNAPG